MAQKKELKRAERARQNAEREAARIRAIEDEEERARAVRDFELTQAGLLTNGVATTTTNNDASHSSIKMIKAASPSVAAGESAKKGDALVVHAGSKRKFSLDADELDRIAENDKAKARKAIEDEKVRWNYTRAGFPMSPNTQTMLILCLCHDHRLPNQHYPHSGHPRSLPTCKTAAWPPSQRRQRRRPRVPPPRSTTLTPFLSRSC